MWSLALAYSWTQFLFLFHGDGAERGLAFQRPEGFADFAVARICDIDILLWVCCQLLVDTTRTNIYRFA